MDLVGSSSGPSEMESHRRHAWYSHSHSHVQPSRPALGAAIDRKASRQVHKNSKSIVVQVVNEIK
jgi:hypothetical protein